MAGISRFGREMSNPGGDAKKAGSLRPRPFAELKRAGSAAGAHAAGGVGHVARLAPIGVLQAAPLALLAADLLEARIGAGLGDPPALHLVGVGARRLRGLRRSDGGEKDHRG